VALVAWQLGEDRDVEPGVGYAGGEQLRTQRRDHPSGNLVRRGSVPEHDEHVQAFPVVDDLVLAQLSPSAAMGLFKVCGCTAMVRPSAPVMRRIVYSRDDGGSSWAAEQGQHDLHR
jgi:hypothetical protein